MRSLPLLLLLALSVSVSACGNRGKLKSPSQIEAEETKKANKEAKKSGTKTSDVKKVETTPTLDSNDVKSEPAPIPVNNGGEN